MPWHTRGVASILPLLILLLTAGFLAVATVFAVSYLRAEARRHQHEVAEFEREQRELRTHSEDNRIADEQDDHPAS